MPYDPSDELGRDGHAVAPARDRPLGATPDLRGFRILLVEDQADSRELLSIVLEIAGAEVCAADSAQAALDVLASFHPHLIISDIGMPVVDGYELIRRIRARERASGFARVPAMALTAWAGREDVERAIAAGFDSHQVKPVDPVTLCRVIGALLMPVRHPSADHARRS